MLKLYIFFFLFSFEVCIVFGQANVSDTVLSIVTEKMYEKGLLQKQYSGLNVKIYERTNIVLDSLLEINAISEEEREVFNFLLIKRPTPIHYRINHTNVDFISLEEELDFSDSTIYYSEEFIFEKEGELDHFIINDIQNFVRTTEEANTRVFEDSNYVFIVKLEPQPYFVQLGCIVPVPQEKINLLEKTKENAKLEGLVKDKTYLLYTYVNLQNGDIKLVFGKPIFAVREVIQLSGP
ncbi:MAG: hypothetical protein N4A41_02600 [Crocinitomicaceae bacterium]|nr:hypothetical protein [Crocinitomicaceae bacterium]